MYFKRLELYGFKSFADKTGIDLDDGITCIVGPNGSGKSNFSDAIKWVLGEQRAGELRGKSMSDVIFAGTERRGAMSYCEVSLVFDNTTRVLFPDMPYDEVVISRKLYRNGESEYLLNRTTTKLKIIRDLIADTGLGKDGFSIIGQGQVAKIIAAKPEDRRTIFEEAAGVGKIKKSRDDAERDLKAVRENLARVTDSVREIERVLPKLEKQADDAKKFVEYRENLKNLEINHYLYLSENNQSVKAAIRDKIQGITEEIEQIERDIAALDKEYLETTVKVKYNDEAITAARDKLTEFLLAKERARGNTNLLSARIEAIDNDINKANAEIERLTKNKNERLAENQVINEKIESVKSDLDTKQVDYDECDNLYAKLVDEIIAREHELEASSRSLIEGMAKLVDISADKSKLVAERDFAKERIVECDFYINKDRAEIEESETKKRELEIVMNVAKDKRDKAYSERVKCRNRANELKFEEQITSREIQDANSSLISLRTKRDIISRMKNDYDSYNNAVKKLMEERKVDRYLNTKVMGVVAELLKVEEKYETAVEIALGANLQHIATPSEDDVKYIIEVLKKKRFGRLTVLPIDVMRPRNIDPKSPVFHEKGCIGAANDLIEYEPKFNNLFANLLGATLVFDTYDNAIAVAKKYNRQYRMVTLDGELIAPGGAITGGSKRSDSSSILSQERDLEKVESLIKKYTAEYEAKSKRIKEITEEHTEYTNRLTAIDEELKSLEIEYATATERAEQAENALDKQLEHMKEYADKKAEYSEKLLIIENALADTERKSSDIEGGQATADDGNNESKARFEAKKQEKDKLLERRERLKLEIAECNITLDNCAENIARINDEIISIEDSIANNGDALIALNANKKQLQESLMRAGLSDTDKNKVDKIEQEIKEKESYKVALNARLTEINSLKDEKNKQNTEARENKVKQAGIIDKIDAQMYSLTERLKEEYDVDDTTARDFYDPEFNESDAPQEIANVKRKITNLGVVNPCAIEEFAETSERYREKSTQLQDTLDAENRLLDLVKELSDEILNRFNAEFDKISTHFKTTFREIFGGGRGELRIDTEAEDPLNAGVEIMAQPPGKTSKNLTLLSGGEMALTAIAILFAILRTRAMPFCILDEIEAALDETNARLFAKYLRRFVEETQFIVITHRKPTMEQADRLYGVTMEEKGISKIVSVELNDAVKTVKSK